MPHRETVTQTEPVHGGEQPQDQYGKPRQSQAETCASDREKGAPGRGGSGGLGRDRIRLYCDHTETLSVRAAVAITHMGDYWLRWTA